MKFSIIIPAYNEEKYISKVMNSLGLLNFPKNDYEIIVVNNGSNDKTLEIIKLYDVNVVNTSKCSPGVARNIGSKIATGQYLAFLDADCIPEKNWLANALKRLSIENCITGSEYKVPQDSSWIERTWFSQEIMKKCNATHINAGNLFIERDFFLKLGGFNEKLVTGEDYELCLRIKEYLPIIPDESIAVVHLGNPKTLMNFLRREIWHGLGAFNSAKHTKFDKVLILTIFFTLFSFMQLIGLFFLIFYNDYFLFLTGSFFVITVLLSTILYRVFNGCNIKIIFGLFLLYYFYYLGRMISLLKIATSAFDYNRVK